MKIVKNQRHIQNYEFVQIFRIISQEATIRFFTKVKEFYLLVL